MLYNTNQGNAITRAWNALDALAERKMGGEHELRALLKMERATWARDAKRSTHEARFYVLRAAMRGMRDFNEPFSVFAGMRTSLVAASAFGYNAAWGEQNSALVRAFISHALEAAVHHGRAMDKAFGREGTARHLEETAAQEALDAWQIELAGS